MDIESYLQKHYSKTTAHIYLFEIHLYLQQNPNASNYNYKAITEHLGVLRIRYSNPNTIRRVLAAIKAYYKYLCYCGQRADNPAKNIILKDKIQSDVQLQDLMNDTELEQLFYHKKERFPELQLRNKVLISLLIYQALTPSEIADLEQKHIQLEQSSIYIKSSHSLNSRTLALQAKQILLFKDYIEIARPLLLEKNKANYQNSTQLILGMRGTSMTEQDITKYIVRIYGQVYKPKKVNCQTIRQSVITNLLKKGNDLRIVQAFAGHKHPGTTEKYKQNNVTQLKLALEFYHPIK